MQSTNCLDKNVVKITKKTPTHLLPLPLPFDPQELEIFGQI